MTCMRRTRRLRQTRAIWRGSRDLRLDLAVEVFRPRGRPCEKFEKLGPRACAPRTEARGQARLDAHAPALHTSREQEGMRTAKLFALQPCSRADARK
eukprot:430322-Pleurochrysis_carterae.AAC.2